MDTGACTTQKICFKVFCNEQKAKMQMKYPFLSKSQINQKLKERWKKMDPTEKMCYTKTVLSPPKFNRGVQGNNLQAGKGSKKITRIKGTGGKSVAVQAKVGINVISPVHSTEMSEMPYTDSQTQNKMEETEEPHTDKMKDKVNSNGRTASKKMINAQKMAGRKTVPWKGRQNEGETDLWSDSSSSVRKYGKKTIDITKGKKIQGILKPNW
jgi:hypothetical protein